MTTEAKLPSEQKTATTDIPEEKKETGGQNTIGYKQYVFLITNRCPEGEPQTYRISSQPDRSLKARKRAMDFAQLEHGTYDTAGNLNNHKEVQTKYQVIKLQMSEKAFAAWLSTVGNFLHQTDVDEFIQMNKPSVFEKVLDEARVRSTATTIAQGLLSPSGFFNKLLGLKPIAADIAAASCEADILTHDEQKGVAQVEIGKITSGVRS